MRKESVVLVIMVCLVFSFFGGALGVEAAEFDLSTQVSGPSAAGPGTTAAITVSYHNAGPDSAANAWVNAWIPSGVPARLIDLTQNQIDALVASVVPDALGNTAYLFADTDTCEHLLFQVQQDVGPSPTGQPIVGLDPGVTGSVSFEIAMPMDPPDLAGLIIDAPPGLAKEYKPTAGFQWFFASEFDSYSVSTCDPTVECSDLSTCFGPRLSYTDPIAGNLELVNDGTLDPTWGCEPLIGYTPGNIAVIERGDCEFGVKALNAQDAGATAVIMVNDGRCSPPDFPDSNQCAIYMGGGAVGDQVNIPIVMLAVDDGQPIINALRTATTVQARMGTVRKNAAFDSGGVFLTSEIDPDLLNNFDSFNVLMAGVFADGFESGDTTAWSNWVP